MKSSIKKRTGENNGGMRVKKVSTKNENTDEDIKSSEEKGKERKG